MRFVELFAGVGGFRYGLEAAGDFRCAWSNELDKHARAVYRYHYGDIDGRDIRDVPPGDIPDADLWTFGPPCQDFSVAGRREGIEGTRGNLTLYTFELLAKKKPPYFLMENVLGLLSIDDGKAFAYIIGQAIEVGYRVEWVCPNSKNFGVPQDRERLFLVGCLGDRPRPEILPVGEDVEELAEGGETYAYAIDSSIGKGPRGSRRRSMISYENDFGKSRVMQDYAGPLRTADLSKRGNAQCVVEENPTIRTTYRSASGLMIRRLTPLECERLQAFPDNWTQYGTYAIGEVRPWMRAHFRALSDTQRYKMMGNAVTTSVITWLGERLLEAL